LSFIATEKIVPCGNTTNTNIMQELRTVLEGMRNAPFDKYLVEALWTRLLHQIVAQQCRRKRGSIFRPGFYGYCDIDPNRQILSTSWLPYLCGLPLLAL
jgi:hypothetical protein